MKVKVYNSPSVNKTLKPVPREQANIEAEYDEVAMTPGNGGIPNTFKVGGKRHSDGGTPLNLEADSFIFSDTPKMKIKDEEVLKSFNVSSKKSGYTPAEIAKKYDINKYKQILLDPSTDKIHKETAETMIANYNIKLGELALIQESMKGLPEGIPLVAMPYLETTGIDVASLLPQPTQQAQPNNTMMKSGGSVKHRVKIMLPKAENGDVVKGKLPEGHKIINDLKDANPKDVNKGLVFMKTPEGKYQRVTIKGFKATGTSKTGTENYKPLTGSLESDAAKAKVILDGMVERGTAQLNSDGTYDISGSAYDDPNLSLEGRELLTKVLSTGTTKKNPDSKNMMLGYENKDKPENNIYIRYQNKNKERGTYGFVNPDLIEYRHYLTTNPYITPSEYDKLPAETKVENRTNYFKKHGITTDDYTDSDKLYTPANMETIVSETEKRYGKDNFRAKAGDDAYYGLEHVDWTQNEPNYELQDFELEESPVNTSSDLGTPTYNNDYAPWWMQDKIKTAGAAMDMARIKKYMPWQGVPNMTLPDPTFYDPERELAANAEQANIAAHELSQFTGPQAFNARYNQVQSAGANNIANTMSRYNNLNVGVANQSENIQTGILNQASQQKAGMDTALYDKHTIVNQQFDNARNMAREHLRQSYIDAITNRQQTQNLNSLYDNYFIDPNDGGSLNFKPGYTKTKPTEQGTDIVNQIHDLQNRLPGLSYDEAIKLIYGKK